MKASGIIRKAVAGKWALVTGASSGIGAALAEDLAAAGAHVVLTARRVEMLQALATRLQTEYGIMTRIVAADLADPAVPQQLFEATEGADLPIDLLVNNAGFGYAGELVKSHAESQRKMVDLNCAAVVHLTRLFLPEMMQRRRGYVMIVASTAAYQPVPYMATYAATKVFDRFFAEALVHEVAGHGVRVSALCPGPTHSEFHDLAGTRDLVGRGKQSAEEVARLGLEGLVQGKPWVIPYAAGKVMVFAQRFVPRQLVSGAAARMFRPR